jgi:hypothetical protein
MTGYKASSGSDDDALRTAVMETSLPVPHHLPSFVQIDTEFSSRIPDVCEAMGSLANQSLTVSELSETLTSLRDILRCLHEDEPPIDDSMALSLVNQLADIVATDITPDLRRLAVQCLHLAFVAGTLPPFSATDEFKPMICAILDFFAARKYYLTSDPFLEHYFGLAALLIEASEDGDLAGAFLDRLGLPWCLYTDRPGPHEVDPDAWLFVDRAITYTEFAPDGVLWGLHFNLQRWFLSPDEVDSLSFPEGMLSLLLNACSRSDAFRLRVASLPLRGHLYRTAVLNSDKKVASLAFPLFCILTDNESVLTWATPQWVQDVCQRLPEFRSDLWDFVARGVPANVPLPTFIWTPYFPDEDSPRAFKVFFTDIAFACQTAGKLPPLGQFVAPIIRLLCDLWDPDSDEEGMKERLISLLWGYARLSGDEADIIPLIQESLDANDLREFKDSSHQYPATEAFAVELWQMLGGTTVAGFSE